MTDSPAQSLHQALIDALQQSSKTIELIYDQQKTIDRLRRENERLQQENQTKTETEKEVDQPDASEQLEKLFRQNVEKQAEIDSLKRELRVLREKEKTSRKQNPRTCSPATASSQDFQSLLDTIPSTVAPTAQITEKRTQHRSRVREQPEAGLTPPHPTKKLRRTNDDIEQPFNEVDVNTKTNSRILQIESSDRSAHGAQAIPHLAEDGESHNKKENIPPKQHRSFTSRDESANERLGALLSTPPTRNQPLPRPASRNRISKSSPPKDSRASMLRQSSSDLAKEAMKPSESAKRRFLPPKPKAAAGPEDDEPLRARPVNRLNLSHFRLNPAVNDGYDFAFSETVRDRDKRKCLPGCTRECCAGTVKFIMNTLGPDLRVSDDDLLLEFLGPGSEQRIRTLTKLARENLIHDARVQKVADKYGKTHRYQHERAQSPVDFWSMDMPSTQEELKNREEARTRERQEVEKRYHEACREGGKWVFADE